MFYERKDKITMTIQQTQILPLAFFSKITPNFGLSKYEMAFNRKSRTPIMFTANASKILQRWQTTKTVSMLKFTTSYTR